jgi:dTDP-4-dehydrorhamnose 3,5-epimerase-like enzyme
MEAPRLINGGKHSDERGTLCFINEFDMAQVHRMYTISHPNTNIIRGWRGHKIEQRWFMATKGTFKVKLIKIDDWTCPNTNLPQAIFILKATEFAVLHVPKGYASSLQAEEKNAELIVFADCKIDEAGTDNYLFPVGYFG